MAIMCHETWLPAAFDTELQTRYHHSFAGHAFIAIRMVLQREVLLALNRIWDSNNKSIKITRVGEHLRSKSVWNALLEHRGKNFSETSKPALDNALSQKKERILELLNKYAEGGSAAQIKRKIVSLRNEQLAHRQLPSVAELIKEEDGAQSSDGKWANQNEVENFYQDTLELVSLLLNLVHGLGYDFAETTKVCKHHAHYFWDGTRSERVQGHPRYIPPKVG